MCHAIRWHDVFLRNLTCHLLRPDGALVSVLFTSGLLIFVLALGGLSSYFYMCFLVSLLRSSVP